MKFGMLVARAYLEGTVSQIHSGLSFHLIKSRKLSCKKWQKSTRFLS